MKRVLAISFLFVFLIAYITPITSVYATEVTWGDDNTYTWSDDEYEMFKKTAVLSLIPDLLSNGVNELSINNASDVDDFVDKLLDYIENNPDSIINTNTWSTLNDLNQAIQNKTEEIGNKLVRNGLVVTGYDGSLHSIFEPQYNNTIPKITYKSSPSLVPIFKRLSRLTNTSPTPTPIPQPDNINILLNYINQRSNTINSFYFYNYSEYGVASNNLQSQIINYPFTDYSWFVCNDSSNDFTYGNNGNVAFFASDLTTLNITYNGTTYSCNEIIYGNSAYNIINNNNMFQSIIFYGSLDNPKYNVSGWTTNTRTINTSGTLEQVLNYIKNYCKNVNITVNGEYIAYVGNVTNNINIDINGLDLYGGTNDPIQYYYPSGTQIDYQKLYEVIKRAIQNNTPISNETIWEGDTYYDSHDNVYSPNIYNYYSDDDESEEDVLDDIINLAIIPQFDTALLQPIEEPIANGEKIMFLGVQSLPEDILFVIGAGFVLILFGAMINRLIE